MVEQAPRVSTHLGYFGSGADRYVVAGYKKAVPPAERLLQVAQVEGLDGVELNYPALVYEGTQAEIAAAFRQSGLAV